MQHIPLDDSVAEQPHAQATRLFAHTRAAALPYVFSSMRLDANMRDVDNFAPLLNLDIQAMWTNWKSIIQNHAGRGGRVNRRVKSKAFFDRVYKMEPLVGHEVPALPGADVEFRPPLYDVGDGALAADDESETSSHSSAGGVAGDSNLRRLLTEYFSACLQTKFGSYFSVPARDAAGMPGYKLFQLLSIKSKDVLVRTFKRKAKHHFRMTIYPLEVWRETGLSCDVFNISDPEHIDLLRFCRGLDGTTSLNIWCEAPAAFHEGLAPGCIRLVNPQVATPSCQLGDKNCPVLCLLDALEELGFVQVERKVTHALASEKVFDKRNSASNRFYFQCLLSLDAVLEKNRIDSFPSGKPACVYRLLLHGKYCEGLSMKQTKLRLAKLDDNAIELLSLQRAAERPRRFRPVVSDDSVHGDASEGEAPSGGGSHDDSSEPCVSEDGSSIVGDDGGVALVGGGGIADYPEFILGVAVKVCPPTVNRPLGLRVICPYHDRCSKYRKFDMWQEEFGARAAERYLEVWLARAPHMSRAAHDAWRPSRVDLRA